MVGVSRAAIWQDWCTTEIDEAEQLRDCKRGWHKEVATGYRQGFQTYVQQWLAPSGRMINASNNGYSMSLSICMSEKEKRIVNLLGLLAIS